MELLDKIADLFNVEVADLYFDRSKQDEHIKNVRKAMGLPTTIAAHFDGDEYTEEELEEIRQFAEFVKNKRKVKCYYTDYTGTRKQKMKRGFSRQKDAKEWERQFLEQQGSPDMSFSAMCTLFLEDKKAHAKLSSYKSEKGRLEAWAIPYFKDKPLNGITAADIRKWQAELKTATGANGEPLSPSYLHNDT